MDEHDENQAVNQLGPKRESQAKKAFIGAPKIKEFLPFPRFSEDNLGTPDSGLLTQEDLEEVLRDPRALHFGDEDSDDNNSIGVDVDDDSSLASSSSEESMTLVERATRNRARHAQKMRELDEKYRGQVPAVKEAEVQRDDDSDDEGDNYLGEEGASVPRGILLKESCRVLNSLHFEESASFPDRVNILLKRYPYRETQIRRLVGLLHASNGQVSKKYGDCYTNAVYVPSPIFVMGPRGTGKTSVVCDVIETLEKSRKQKVGGGISTVGSAYINCDILEPSSVERLVSFAYNQLRPKEHKHTKRRRQRRKRKRRRSMPTEELSSMNSDTRAELGDTTTGHSLETDSQKATKQGEVQVTAGTEGLQSVKQISQKGSQDISDRRVQPRRAVKALSQTNVAVVASQDMSSQKVGISPSDTVEISNSAVVAFGRSLSPFYGVGAKRSAVLVLDHAEHLLSLSAKMARNQKTNFLAELLLLPKVMKLNLTVVVITRYSTLNDSRECCCAFLVPSGPFLSLNSTFRFE